MKKLLWAGMLACVGVAFSGESVQAQAYGSYGSYTVYSVGGVVDPTLPSYPTYPSVVQNPSVVSGVPTYPSSVPTYSSSVPTYSSSVPAYSQGIPYQVGYGSVTVLRPDLVAPSSVPVVVARPVVVPTPVVVARPSLFGRPFLPVYVPAVPVGSPSILRW